ncbi:MAG: S8 family serine peptidase [Lachnospiraceae bacterium]
MFQDFIGGRKRPYDDNGHGTHVAGLIMGKAGKGSAGNMRRSQLRQESCGGAEGAGINGETARCRDVVESPSGGSGKTAGFVRESRVINISRRDHRKRNQEQPSKRIQGVEELWDEGCCNCDRANSAT